MSWNRTTLESALTDAYQAAGTDTFTLTIPPGEMPAVLMQLNHLTAINRITTYDRRMHEQVGEDCCVEIYGFTPLE